MRVPVDLAEESSSATQAKFNLPPRIVEKPSQINK